MKELNSKKFNLIGRIVVFLFIAFSLSPIFGIVSLIAIFLLLKLSPKLLTSYFSNQAQATGKSTFIKSATSLQIPPNIMSKKTRLIKRKKYLQVALNSTLDEAREIITQLPISDRILIEAGTPLIKIYGAQAVVQIKEMAPVGAYIVADIKCIDVAVREVEIMAHAGANAATCLGVAPIETIDRFIESCQTFNIDSMIDMMNVESAIAVLKKLKKLPSVVMLHRGVDETEFSKEKQIPYYQIKQIKGNYSVLVAVAGGDTIREVQRAAFNDADIVVVWKNFYQASADTARLAESFLKEIK